MNASFLKSKKTNKKTNSYYEKEVWAETNRIYCLGPIKPGNFITTCPSLGTAMIGANEDVAIGINLGRIDEHRVGEVDVILFE